jgi:AraC-like DNA-binding protein
MLLSREVWSVLLIYGVVQGTLLAGALVLNPRGRRLANVFLAALLMITVGHALPFCLLTNGVLEKFPHAISAPVILLPALGPLFYFYTRTVLQPDYKPGILVVAITTLLPGAARFAEWKLAGADLDVVVTFFYALMEIDMLPISRLHSVPLVLLNAYTMIFLFAAWRLVKLMDHDLRVQYAGATDRHLAWLRFLAIGLLIIELHLIVVGGAMIVTGETAASTELIASLVKCLFIQSVAITSLFLPEGVTSAVGDLPVRNRRTSDDVAAADRDFRALQEFMDERKPYRIENLRLADLAAMLSVPAREISELINDRLHMTFCDFVNMYRVADAKAMLHDSANDQFTLLAVAREAGFSSKSSFNRVFKKHTGKSPSQYRDSIQPADDSESSSKLCGDSPG